jgi:hypothetical protein
LPEVKFCAKCHKEVYRLVEDSGNIKVMQGSRSVINLNAGSRMNVNLKCPAGHTNKVHIGEEEEMTNPANTSDAHAQAKQHHDEALAKAEKIHNDAATASKQRQIDAIQRQIDFHAAKVADLEARKKELTT